jgi:gliding motility-associated-like protein
MRQLISLLALIALFQISSAQSPADWWYFGANAGLHFTGSGPVAVTNGQTVTQEGCASISDNNGNLLFYTDGSTIWNANHNTMTNGTGLLGNNSSTQSAIIVPYPGVLTKYYVFTVPVTSSVGLRYSVVDMTLSSGLGAVTAIKNVLVSTPVGEKVTAVAHANNQDYWVMCVKANADTVRAFHVSGSGVNTTPVNSPSMVNFSSGIGYLKASPNGSKVAAGIYQGTSGGLSLWQFNNATGVLSNQIHIGSTYLTNGYNIYGVEWAPNDTLVYAAASSAIYQMSTATWTTAGVGNSKYVVHTGSNQGWALQLGPDEKIYNTNYLQTNLGRVANPNISGSGCSYTNNAISLSTGVARIGLPTFMQSFFSINVSYEGLCFGDQTWFEADSANIDSIFWNFDDPSTGALNTSSEFAPFHVFSDTGTYNVLVVAYSDSAALVDSSYHEVYIYPRQTVDLGPDQTLCVGLETTFSADQEFASFEWSTGSTDSAIVVTYPDSIIMVTVTGFCDTVSDTVIVHWFYPFVVDLGNDTSLCTYDTDVITTGLSNSLQFQWHSGSTQPNHNVLDTGLYSVTVTDGTCNYSDSVHYSYYPEVLVNLGNDSNFCYEPLVTLAPKSQSNVVSYHWSTNSTNSSIPIVQTGVYTVTVSGIGGHCQAEDEVEWSLWFEPMVEFPQDTYKFCNNGNVTLYPELTSQFQMEYLWNNNSQGTSTTTNQSGLYWIQASDEHCTMRDSAIVAMHPLLTVTLGEDIQSCEGKTVNLRPISNQPLVDFHWSDGSQNTTYLVSEHGTYGITVYDEFCSANDQVNVFMFKYPEVDLGPDTSVCQDTEFTFDMSSTEIYNYAWYDGSNQPVKIEAADKKKTIWLSVTNVVCTTTDSISIFLFEKPQISLTEDTNLCEDQTILITAEGQGEYSYRWSNGNESASTLIRTPGIFTVTASDGHCEAQASIDVHGVAIPTLNLEAPEFICLGEEIVLDAKTEKIQFYRWDDGSTQPTRTVDAPGIYYVEANHECAKLTATVLIWDCECFVRLPNAFHPNGDANNEVYGPSVDCQFISYHFEVWNRWGELMFETDDATKGWDGTHNGYEVEPGAYVWKLEYEAILNGEIVFRNEQGSVALLR